MKPFIVIFLIITILSSIGWTQVVDSKYIEIDSLINTGSLANSMHARKLLESEYLYDTLNSNYWIKYSLASFNLYKYSDAFFGIDKAIKNDSKNPDAYFEKSKLVMEIEGNNFKAIALLDTAIMLRENGKYFFYRGIYNQLSDNITNAMSDYESAFQLGYEHQGLYRNFSILLFKSEMSEKALYYINKGIELNPEISENYKTRGEIYLALSDPDKACADFEIAITKGYRKRNDFRSVICLDNNDLNKYSLTGDVLAKMGMYTSAINAYGKAILEEKDTARYYLNRGYCYFKLGNYENAEKDYHKAYELAEQDLLDLLYDNLSLLYFEIQEYEKSIQYSSKRIELNPNNHVPYIDRGLCYRKLKEYKKAEADFNKSLSIKPDFFRALGYRAFLFLELGFFQKAFDDATNSVVHNPEYAYGYLVLGQAKQALKIPDYCIDFQYAKMYGNEDADMALKEFCN